MSNNAYSFADLSLEQKENLLNYINENFSIAKSFNHEVTAYGLKQRFTRLFGDKDLHVTSKCFMEAMLEAGFQAKPVPDVTEPNWYFNVYLKAVYRKPHKHQT